MNSSLDVDCSREVLASFSPADRFRFEIVAKSWQAHFFDNLHHLSTADLFANEKHSAVAAAGRLHYVIAKFGRRLDRVLVDGRVLRDVDEYLMDFLAKNAPALTELRFSNVTFSHQALRLLAKLTSLQTFSLANCTVVRVEPPAVASWPLRQLRARFLRWMYRIYAAYIGSTLVYDESYDESVACTKELVSSLRALKSLRSFELLNGRTSDQLLAEDVKLLYIPDLSCIQSQTGHHLSFNYAGLITITPGNVTQWLQARRSLVELQLGGTPNLRVGSPRVSESLWRQISTQCPHLRSLTLSDSVDVDFGSLKRLRCSTLRELQCTFYGMPRPDVYQFTDEDVIEICRQNPALTILNLVGRSTYLTRAAFCEGFARLHNLVALHVSNVNIDDDAFEDVCRANVRSLRAVWIKYAPLLTEGALRVLGQLCSGVSDNASDTSRRLALRFLLISYSPNGAYSAPSAVRAFVDAASSAPLSQSTINVRVLGAADLLAGPAAGADVFACLKEVAASQPPPNVSVKYFAQFGTDIRWEWLFKLVRPEGGRVAADVSPFGLVWLPFCVGQFDGLPGYDQSVGVPLFDSADSRS